MIHNALRYRLYKKGEELRKAPMTNSDRLDAEQELKKLIAERFTTKEAKAVTAMIKGWFWVGFYKTKAQFKDGFEEILARESSSKESFDAGSFHYAMDELCRRKELADRIKYLAKKTCLDETDERIERWLSKKEKVPAPIYATLYHLLELNREWASVRSLWAKTIKSTRITGHVH